ncbi:MAG: hypothetical protein KHW49_02850 [Eubacterium sp.]|jgi:hypothetical protein|nr:hypothetical protein [Eubacterium sp.]
MSKKYLDLQRFAEGAAAGGEGGTVEETVDDAQKESTKIVYGKEVTEDTSDEGEEPEKIEPEETEPTFEELIEGKYKAEFDKKVQDIVKNRVKNIKGAEDNMHTLAPALSVLAEKYGVTDANDLAGLVQAITDDDALYEQEAMDRGIDIPTLKHIKSIEAQNKVFAEEMARKERDTQNMEAWQDILRQSEDVKKFYPDFNIETEMQNENFGHLVAVGVPVKTAFETVHLEELQAQMAGVVAKNTAKKVANSVRANRKRSGEAGGNGQSIQVKRDPKLWTNEERDDIYERVQNGELIYL